MPEKKALRAIMSRGRSPAFPILLKWRLGTVEHSDVFGTTEQAKNYIIGRYGKVKIIDRTAETASGNKEER